MRPILIILCAILACLCCCSFAEACPLGRVLGIGKAAAKAPLKVLKVRPVRRLVGRGCN